MSPAPADRQLRKVTLNLYEEDVAYAEEHLGFGWSAILREHFGDLIAAEKIRRQYKAVRKTLGDLSE